MTRPRLLDLFCCEGGAGMGYHRAGFDVVGVDVENFSNRYPFEFHQADALEYLEAHGEEFDAIHASPPCQEYSVTRFLPGTGGHPKLVEVTRELLVALGKPWIMENVPGAPMPNAVVLCGSMFDLSAVCDDGKVRQLRRHRLFEHSPEIPLWPPYSCSHKGQAIGVYGHGGTSPGQRGRAATAAEARQALGIDWMSRDGMSQSIPPAYTEPGPAVARPDWNGRSMKGRELIRVPCPNEGCDVGRWVATTKEANAIRDRQCRACYHKATAFGPERIEMVPCVECEEPRPVKVKSRAGIRKAALRACVDCGLRNRYASRRAKATEVDEDIDDVVVDRLAHGIPVNATPAERRAAAARLTRNTDWTTSFIAERVGVGYQTVKRIRRKAA